MHFPLAAVLRSRSFDVLTHTPASFSVRRDSRRQLTACFRNLAGAAVFGGVCLWGLPNFGTIGYLLANFAGLLASVALLCAVQSAVWLVLQLPTLQFDTNSTTVYLTGWRPITLEQKEIAEVVLHGAGGDRFSIALELVSPEAVRRGLTVFDRFCFDCRERFTGYGFSDAITLRRDDQAKLVSALRAQFGPRVTSQLPEGDAAFSGA